MKKLILILTITIIFIATANASENEIINYGSFGNITIYKPTGTPKSCILFISGDGGWNKGVVNMAKNIAEQGAMVAGLNIITYYKNIKKDNVKCYYPASDFENLSLEIQKRYKFPDYFKPILIGYSSGSTLVYGALAQAPANTFKGAIALGFSPDIELDKTLCDGLALTTKVLKELNLDYSNRNLVIRNYVYYLISNSIYKTETYLETLRKLKNICIELNLEHNYMNFYLLYFAKDDLVEQEYQHYWNDANRENIDDIITENFKNWKTEYETEQN